MTEPSLFRCRLDPERKIGQNDGGHPGGGWDRRAGGYVPYVQIPIDYPGVDCRSSSASWILLCSSVGVGAGGAVGAGNGVAGGIGVGGMAVAPHTPTTASSRRLAVRKVAIRKFIFDSITFPSTHTPCPSCLRPFTRP